jgi:hypothetical protein
MELVTVKENDILVVEVDTDRMPPSFKADYLESIKKTIKEAFPNNKLLVLPSMAKVKITVVQAN